MDQSLQVLLLLAIIIGTAKLGGVLSQRLGQAAVLGEMLVGLILGPTLLDLLHWPVFTHGAYAGHLVQDLAQLGVIFLMFLAGLETDLPSMRQVGGAATLSAIGGMAVPFGGGVLLGRAFGLDLYASVFMATILTATSVSISAQTLIELGQLKSRVGNAILGAAVIDDVLGIVLLSVVIALHHSPGAAAPEPVWLLLVRVVGFFAVALGVGGWLVPRFLHRTRRWRGHELPFAAAVVMALAFAFAAAYFGRVAAITGSYFLGALLSQDRELTEHITERLRPLAYGFFVPLFFVSVGLAGDLLAALRASGPAFAALVLFVALAGKVLGCGLGVRAFGFNWPESLQVGVGMISRGEVGLIAAGIGLASHTINEAVYSVMLAVVVITTLVTPPLLRAAFYARGKPPVLRDAEL